MKKRIACLLLTLVMLVSLIPTAAITASAAGLAISEAGIKVIKDYMGFKKNAYQVGSEWRIGYGTPSVEGATITEANADQYLRYELSKLDNDINSGIAATLVQKRHDALVWYSYLEGTAWLAGSALKTAVENGKVGSEFVDAMCCWSFAAGGYPDDAESSGVLIRRMAIANLYLNGVYSSANSGSLGYTVFDAGEGVFPSGAKKAVKAFDCSQMTEINVAAPSNGAKQFLGWYKDNALVTGVGSATSGKTLTAHWQDGMDKVAAWYTLPAYIIYQADSIPDDGTVVVMKSPAVLQGIDTISRDSVVTVVAEAIYGGNKWLELSTGGWVKLCAAGAVLPTIVPSVNVTITDDYVNIRKTPDVTGQKVGMAMRGETRTIVMTVQNDAWGYCSEGWIFLAYTDYNDKSASVDASGTPIKGTGTSGKIVGAERVNVRSDAGVYNTLVTTLAQGTAVTVYEQTTVNGAPWGHIDQGWVSMQYVQLNQTAVNTNQSVSVGNTVVVSSTVNLNVRSGPGTEYTKVGTLAPGTSVVILQKQTVGGVSWALIDQGWINMNYVSSSVTSSGSSAAGVGGTVVNCTSGVNVRSAAGTTNALVGVAALGSRVTVTERVEVNGHYWGHIATGWVCMDYIQLDREFTEQPATTVVDSDVVTSFVGYPAVTDVVAPVYASASSDAKVVMTLNAATTISITDRVVSGVNTFGKVTVGSITGWINLADVILQPVNAKVTAAKADAYELPNTRSVCYASLVNGTYVTIGNSDGSGWELADGALWGQTSVTAADGPHIAWIKLADVTMFKDNTMPTGITTLNGVGYLTGTVRAASQVFADSNGNVTTNLTDYTLVAGHKVNIQARNFDPATFKTWAKITVGTTTGWIDFANVELDPIVLQATTAVPAMDSSHHPVADIAAGTRITVLARDLSRDYNMINHGITDLGLVYINDDADTLYWIILDEGKLAHTTLAPSVNNSNPNVLSGVVVTGIATAGTSIYEEAMVGSNVLLQLNAASKVTVLNWKNIDGKTWGKVQVGQIVGWVDVTQIDFSGLNGTVAVDQLSVYNKADKDSSVQILRVNNKIVNIDGASLYFDGITLWGRIQVADKEGWIDLANVLLNTPGVSYSPELVIASGKVNSVAAVAYLADNPMSLVGAEVVTLPKDTKVNLVGLSLAMGRAWWKVDLDDKDGWTDMEFITMNPAVARITTASAPIYNDLMTAGTPGAETLYTLYRDETITVNEFRMRFGDLYGQVTYGTTTGWILICDSTNAMSVSLTPGTTTNPGTDPTTAPTAAPNAPAATEGTAAYIVCNSVVNVRSAADPTSQLVTTLPNGTVVTITEQTTYIGKAWAHIAQGWVCMDYVKIGVPTTTVNTNNAGSVSIMTSVPAGAIAVAYANDNVKVRSGSSSATPETGTLKKGNSVVIYEKALNEGISWGRTDSGWVNLNSLTITGIGTSGSGSSATIGRCGFAANIRSSASTAGAQLGKVMVSSRIQVLETAIGGGGETWARTELGWITMQYVVMDTEAAPIIPTATEAAAVDGNVG